jgi:hypothetical protein
VAASVLSSLSFIFVHFRNRAHNGGLSLRVGWAVGLAGGLWAWPVGCGPAAGRRLCGLCLGFVRLLPGPVLPPFCPRFAPLLPLCFPRVCGILFLCLGLFFCPPGAFLPRSALFLLVLLGLARAGLAVCRRVGGPGPRLGFVSLRRASLGFGRSWARVAGGLVPLLWPGLRGWRGGWVGCRGPSRVGAALCSFPLLLSRLWPLRVFAPVGLLARCGVGPPAVVRVAFCGWVGVALAPGGGFAPASFARVRSRPLVRLPSGVAPGGLAVALAGPASPLWRCVVSGSVVSVRSLAFSAFRSGGLVSFVVRPSSRSFSGSVLVARFSGSGAARRFARSWARRLGVSVAVRSGFSVSVPVALAAGRRPSSRSPFGLGRLVVVRGRGVVGFWLALRSAGWLVSGV